MPPAAGAGRGADCPAGPKPVDSGGRPRRTGGCDGEGDGGPHSSLDTQLVSGGVPYSSSPDDDDVELGEAGRCGGRCAPVSALNFVFCDLVIICSF